MLYEITQNAANFECLCECDLKYHSIYKYSYTGTMKTYRIVLDTNGLLGGTIIQYILSWTWWQGSHTVWHNLPTVIFCGEDKVLTKVWRHFSLSICDSTCDNYQYCGYSASYHIVWNKIMCGLKLFRKLIYTMFKTIKYSYNGLNLVNYGFYYCNECGINIYLVIFQISLSTLS